MPNQSPFRLSREPVVSNDQVERIHGLAVDILQEIGLEVLDGHILECLREEGFRTDGQRVLFEPHVVEEYVEAMRGWIRSRPKRDDEADDGRLTMSVSSYPMYVHNVEEDDVVPFTTERLIEACKLVDSLADEGVYGAPPGIPIDEPPDLQPIAQYRIAALYARQGATPVDPTSADTVNDLLDMAEVMGRPVDALPVYMPTPLRLGGESLEVVMACIDRLSHVWVSSMPATGATAPLHPFGGLALATAEVMGGMVALRALTGKPALFSSYIFPFDLHVGAMVFGSPENMLFQMLSDDFNRFYGWERGDGPDNVHVMAKLPDAQSGAEKAAIMALGAFLGERHFSCAGALSLDEIFSPEQLLVDCEIRDWVERAIQGLWMGEEAVDDWLAEVRAGLDGSFIMLDSTLDHYKRHVWYPTRFERGAIGAWTERGRPRLSERLRDEVRRRVAGHDFELAPQRRREIERIYQSARAKVVG